MKTTSSTISLKLSQPLLLKTKSRTKWPELDLRFHLLPVFKVWTTQGPWFQVVWISSVMNWSVNLLLATSKPLRIWSNGHWRKTVRFESTTWSTLEMEPKVSKHFSTLERSYISKPKSKNWTKKANHGDLTTQRIFKWNLWCSTHGLEFHWLWLTRRRANTRQNFG